SNTHVGGLYFSGTTLTVKSSTTSGNTATNGKGGGLYLYSGSATITKSVISGNSAYLDGGGVYALSTVNSLTITSSAISSNRTTDENAVADGGGLETRALQTTITKSTIAGNECQSSGGGISLVGGALTWMNSIVSGNHADKGVGGGLEIPPGGAATISGCIFSGDTAMYGGAVHVARSSPGLTIRNTTISGNTATKTG